MSCNYSWLKSEHHGSVSLAEGQHTTGTKADSTNGQDSNVSTPTPDLVVESSLIYSSLGSYLDPVTLRFSIEDMKLLYFYTTSTSLTFAERPETTEIYSAVAPVVAFSEPGLLSSILAVAALHRAHIEPEPENREKYFNIAASHQSRSIGILHELLTKITPENCSAIFLTSSLIPIFTLAAESWLRQPCIDVAPTSSFDDVMNCVHLLRGVPSILSYGNHTVFDWIVEGPLRPLAESFLLKPVGQLGPEQEAQFAALHQALAGDEGIAEEELQVYLEALRILKEYAELVLDTRV